MNIAPLRRTILKELVIFSVVVAMLGGVVWYVDSLREDFLRRNSAATSETNQLLAKKQETETKFRAVQDNMQVYDESQRWVQQPGLFIDSQAVRDLFNFYQSVLFLKKISVDMQPIINVTDDPQLAGQSPTAHFVATKTIAKVQVEVATDEDIYNLIAVMKKELPGFMNISSFSMSRTKTSLPEIISQLRKEGVAAGVVVNMEFDWYGLKSIDEASNFNKYVAKRYESQNK